MDLMNLIDRARLRKMRKTWHIPASCGIGTGTRLYGEGTIEIGKDVHISEHTMIHAGRRASIKIGDKVSISHHVDIRATNPHDTIILEVGAFIGAKAYIEGSLTMGRYAKLGALSLTKRSIPDYEVWGGVPAQFIKMNEVKES
jgi:acetyltransferase-like isoleucine patch superfamily enzyme